MTVYLYENFAGTASIDGTTPETNLQSGLTWVVSNGTAGQTLQLKNDSGFMKYTPVGGVPTDTVLALLGGGTVSRGLPAPVSAAFLLETHSSSATDSRWQINFYYSGLSVVASVTKTADTSWQVSIGGVTTTITGLGLSASSVHRVTISVADGAQSITALGVTSNATVAFPGTATASGLTGIAMLVRNTGRMRLEYVADIDYVAPGGGIAASLPRASVVAYGGINAAATLPTLSVASGAGATMSIGLPSIMTTALAHDSTGEQMAAIALPRLAVSASAGGIAEVDLPGMACVASATTTGFARPVIKLPTLAFSAAATVSSMSSAAISLPALGATGFAGAVCSITLDGVTAQATSVTGSIGRAHVTLPLFSATAAATADNFASAAITVPSIHMDTGGVAPIALPGLKLIAIGSAVVTATYEAYAINLGHTPKRGEDPVDETTRYTNFPFTHIVRHKNSYYGANATGLYLLEGTTDDGAAIPYAVKTAITDFKSPTRKTVAAAYFGGRLGPAASVSLHAGDGAQAATYSYATPRGALAQNHRQAFGRGIRQHRYYAIGIEGEGAMELDSLELNVHNSTRRI